MPKFTLSYQTIQGKFHPSAEKLAHEMVMGHETKTLQKTKQDEC